MRTERANAKINLFLDVTAKRENGYHEIVSIMQTVSLCDLVTVDFRPHLHTSVHLNASGNDRMPTDCRNLAWRAAELFLSEVGRTGEVFIGIEKHIPMAAGLAGGSADAAAVLRGLNALCDAPLHMDALCELGSRLGADVPFCIVGGTCLAQGIGEQLKECPSAPDVPMVVACKGEGVSTPWAYGRLDERYRQFVDGGSHAPLRPLLSALETQAHAETAKYLYNIFEEVVPAVHGDIEPLKQVMREEGAAVSMMSGSGPSVFGMFEEHEAAARACKRLREMGAAAFVCHPQGKYQM